MANCQVALKRLKKAYPKLMDKFKKVKAVDESLKNRPSLKASYSDNWVDLVNFELCDAAKPNQSYIDDEMKDITHIYSYNKVMSKEDTAGIAKILNQTNYKVLAWYFGPVDTKKSGLRDVIYMGRMSMTTTGKERFSAYVYFRVAKYIKGIEPIWDQYDEEEYGSEEDEEEGVDEASEDKGNESPILMKSSKCIYRSW